MHFEGEPERTWRWKGELGMQRTDADLNSYERRQKELIGLTTAGGHS